MGAKRQLTSFCNGDNRARREEMSGLCRNPEQINSTVAGSAGSCSRGRRGVGPAAVRDLRRIRRIDPGVLTGPVSLTTRWCWMLGGDAKPTRAPRETRKRNSVAKERVERDEEDLVRLYLTDIGQYPLLTKDDEVRLAQAIEGGNAARCELEKAASISASKKRELRRSVTEGEQAQRTFVQSNLRLVVSIAKKYQASGLPLLDLIQEGNLGLMHAVEKFDWRKGFKFSTYATWWIRQAITRGIANGGRTIRLPVHASDLLNQTLKSRARLEAQLGRRPNVSELASDLEVSTERVVTILRHAAAPGSLSEPLGHDTDAELGDVLEDRGAMSPLEAAAAALLPGEVAKMLVSLDEREREIIRLRFGLDRGEPRTLEEVGVRFGLTRERIRQIEARAMSKLRHPTASGDLHELLISES